ncbi:MULTISPECIES: hypothetical protein [unclassified Microbacterium]|uniref:hypothetical protein n=1 Tax=unclassified Microbacterium TaxID=2609290 RepID=UPI000B35C4E7|nr:hypothetical protein [Microbacterium sp. JB110]RCS57321.1 hypothetical protein CIK77_16935 [Microbacterium sp. JB110]
MVRLLLDQAQLEIELSGAERVLALRKESVRVPRAAIRSVQLTDDPWTRLRGVRRPGTHIAGLLAAGSWQRTSGRDFVMLRGRARDGVVITLDDEQEFQRVLLTTSHARDLVAALRLDDVEKAADVTDLAGRDDD